MDSKLAVLFYIGVVIPTAITITVFIGFLICLYKRNSRRDQAALKLDTTSSRSRLIDSYRATRSATNDKFESSSQHSNDSAIDLQEIDLHMDLTKKRNSKPMLLLNAGKLASLHTERYEVSNHICLAVTTPYYRSPPIYTELIWHRM